MPKGSTYREHLRSVKSQMNTRFFMVVDIQTFREKMDRHIDELLRSDPIIPFGQVVRDIGFFKFEKRGILESRLQLLAPKTRAKFRAAITLERKKQVRAEKA